jgi:hypothetical protein
MNKSVWRNFSAKKRIDFTVSSWSNASENMRRSTTEFKRNGRSS